MGRVDVRFETFGLAFQCMTTKITLKTDDDTYRVISCNSSHTVQVGKSKAKTAIKFSL